MNAQTPRIAAATAYAKTGDLEAAYLAGYAAEGRIGMGRAPEFSDGPTAGRRRDRSRKYNTSVMQRILAAVAEGHNTAAAVGDAVGIGRNYAASYLNKLADAGKLQRVGTMKVNNATAILWGLTE